MIPTWKLDIAIYAGGSVGFSGETPDRRDLGGAEYCAVKVAEALAALGHRVVVFTPDDPEVYSGRSHVVYRDVTYYPRRQSFKAVSWGTQWDVFIVSRDFSVLTSNVIQAKLLVLWNHDILADPEAFREHIWRADKIYCLSNYHRQQYLRALKDESGQWALETRHIDLTRNGVDAGLVRATLESLEPGEKYPLPTFIYTSRPERGLAFLLRDIWPRIVRLLPQAQLRVACYDVEAIPPRIAEMHQECYWRIKQDLSVQFLGALPRRALFREVALSHFMLYPAIFPEVSCLAVLEAQALGTPALTSSRGALAESNLTSEHRLFDDQDVEAGRYGVEDYNPWTFQYIKEYFHTYHMPKRLLSRDKVSEQVLAHHDWEKIAQEWEADFYRHFRERAYGNKGRVVENLLYHSDILAAKDALHKIITPMISEPKQPSDMGYHTWCELRDQVEGYLSTHHQEPDLYSGHEGAGLAALAGCPERMGLALDRIAQVYGTHTPFTLLDIGCGSGRFLYHALKRFPNCQVMGLDFSAALCAQAAANLGEAFSNFSGDSCLLPVDFLGLSLAEFFEGTPLPDVVFAGEWLEHQSDLLKALSQVHAACKTGGLVIYTTPYGPWEAISFGAAKTEAGSDIRFHVSHFEHRDFEEMFRELDYRLEATAVQHSPLDVSILGNFVVSYRKPERPVHFHLPDYERKFVTTRPYQRLAGLLITRDEEDHITRALKPLVRRLDRLLVYDTGSRDSTCQLAEQYAHMVVRGYWDEDFAAARNRALHVLRDFPEFDADWVYWQDADEVLLEPYKLRWYLQGDLAIYEGFILTQNHLMVDNPMTVDIPIRLFRNRSHYNFIGKIHEHVLDLRDPDGNTNLFPLMILPDVKIAHFGYLNEALRRDKATSRNWAILKRDLEENPKRELTQIFLMRDYVQFCRWHLERSDRLTEEHVRTLHEVIRLYTPFAHATHQNHVLARVFYQDALRLLGEQGLPGPSGRVPIQARLLLAAKRGPLPAGEAHTPEERWFADSVELARYMERSVEHAARFVDREVRLFAD